MTIFLLCVLITLSLLQIGFLIAFSRLLVKMQDSDASRVRRFLESRGLIDIPIVREGQIDYTDTEMRRSISKDLRIVKNN